MQDNCNYDKIRLLADVSKLIARVERHYIKDAEQCNHPLCTSVYKELVVDLKKYHDKLTKAIAGISSEGKLK